MYKEYGCKAVEALIGFARRAQSAPGVHAQSVGRCPVLARF